MGEGGGRQGRGVSRARKGSSHGRAHAAAPTCCLPARSPHTGRGLGAFSPPLGGTGASVLATPHPRLIQDTVRTGQAAGRGAQTAALSVCLSVCCRIAGAETQGACWQGGERHQSRYMVCPEAAPGLRGGGRPSSGLPFTSPPRPGDSHKPAAQGLLKGAPG